MSYTIINPTDEFPSWYVFDEEYPDEGAVECYSREEAEQMQRTLQAESDEDEETERCVACGPACSVCKCRAVEGACACPTLVLEVPR